MPEHVLASALAVVDSVAAPAVADVAEVDARTWSVPLAVVAIAIAAYVVTRANRLVIHVVVRRLAARSVRGGRSHGVWRTRVRRPGTETADSREQRRRQRIDAATRMLNHVASVIVWIVASVAVFHLLDVDAALFLSGAGFIGAGLAIGGQHRVNDYLTGLAVHFEDRYGVGDEIVADIGWAEPIHAVVDHVGLFSTRLRDSASTVHVPNASLAQVRNVSQESAAATLRVRLGGGSTVDDAVGAARAAAGTERLTDVVFLGDISGHDAHTGEVELGVRTLRPLDPRTADELVARVEEQLAADDEGPNR